MTRVDRMEQLLDSLRQQLLEKAEANRGTAEAASAGRPNDIATEQATGGISELKERLSQELRSYDLSTAAMRRKARLSFLESVLAWDFGSQIVRDQRFSDLVENIEATICENQDVSKQLDELLAGLARGAV